MNSVKLYLCGLLLVLSLLMAANDTWRASAQSPAGGTALPVGKTVRIKAPLGLPPVPIPPDNPPTADTIALGRRLYYDAQLSVDGTISCASCHAPQFAFADEHPVSFGVGKKAGTRHAPTVINSAYNPLQFRDGRAPKSGRAGQGTDGQSGGNGALARRSRGKASRRIPGMLRSSRRARGKHPRSTLTLSPNPLHRSNAR